MIVRLEVCRIVICMAIGCVVSAIYILRHVASRKQLPSMVTQTEISRYLKSEFDSMSEDQSSLFIVHRDAVSAPSQASEKNQAMDRLMAGRDMAPEDFSALMRRLHADGKQDELTRNFAVQHLGLYVQRRIRLGEYDPKSREALEIRSTLEAAAGETHSTVASPAFKALAELAAVDPAVVEGGLDARLVACAGDASANVPTRVIAVQLCGARRLAAARPALKAILSDPKSGTVLKLAARRALREFKSQASMSR